MKILIINGPNINLLGIREPDIYGKDDYKQLQKLIKLHCKSRKIGCKQIQTNYEGKIITEIQKALGKYDGIVINPAGYTHTSVAIADALSAVKIPTVEVHISDINAREEFRKHSFVSPVALKTISGHGLNGYIEAIDFLADLVEGKIDL